MMDTVYQMNHRRGEIGLYKLLESDPKSEKYVMHCKNPYPCDMDRWIITTMAKKFIKGVKVEVMLGLPSQSNVDEESWCQVTHE